MTIEPSSSDRRYWFWIAPRERGSDVLREVAERHGLSIAEIKTQTRARRIAWPRQEAMWEMRRRTKLSMPQIAQLLGLKDHTTVWHGVKAHEKRREASKSQ